MATQERLLFAALIGSSDCPLPALQSAHDALVQAGRTAVAAQLAQVQARFVHAEQRLAACAYALPFDPGAAEAALHAHSQAITAVQCAFDIHAEA